MNEATSPPLAAIHHLALTVTDLDASIAWYQRVLGFERAGEVAHHEARSTGHGVMLLHPVANLPVVLHHHDANDGEAFVESRTGMDHAGLAVPTRAALDSWRERFDELGVTQSPIADLEEHEVSVLVFRDPDDIQLELISPIR
jgi:catechol 2,3-dioxygenase-like lactoylglutathione lyase family enzyme